MEKKRLLAGCEMLFWGKDSVPVLCATVVVCVQQQVSYLVVRDWEEVQMGQEKLSFSQRGSYFHSQLRMW